jgi:thiamine-phosphate pyrophosphorylase
VTRALDPSLYLVTERGMCAGGDLENLVRLAVGGGATMVQLREKHCGVREFVELARALVRLLSPLGVPLIVNDRLDVALASAAHGLHLGQTDMEAADARALLGPGKILGLSVENMDQARTAQDLDVDYLGVSPIHATPTKTDTAEPWGLDGLARLAGFSRLPLVAIGGIDAETAEAAIRAGAHGVAVVSALCAAADPRKAAQNLRLAVERGRLAKNKDT